MTIPARDPGIVTRWKRARRKAGQTACDSCGWRVPAAVLEMRPASWKRMQAHHVVPLSCGGVDLERNLVLLCPNCHVLAHALATERHGAWVGPRTPADLLHQLEVALAGGPGCQDALRETIGVTFAPSLNEMFRTARQVTDERIEAKRRGDLAGDRARPFFTRPRGTHA